MEFTEVVVVQWRAGSDSMISMVMKSHTCTNKHTVRGTPTLKVVKRFRKRSVCKVYERSIYEWTFGVNLSRIMLYQRSYHPGKKHLQKSHRIFRRDREPSRIPERTHNVWATIAERLENLFLLLTNVSVWVHRSKTLWETSLSIIQLKSRTKRHSRVMCLLKNEAHVANYFTFKVKGTIVCWPQ